jgi:hypothetical protein
MRVRPGRQLSGRKKTAVDYDLMRYAASDIEKAYPELFGEGPHLVVHCRHPDIRAWRGMVYEQAAFIFGKNACRPELFESGYHFQPRPVMRKTKIKVKNTDLSGLDPFPGVFGQYFFGDRLSHLLSLSALIRRPIPLCVLCLSQ